MARTSTRPWGRGAIMAIGGLLTLLLTGCVPGASGLLPPRGGSSTATEDRTDPSDSTAGVPSAAVGRWQGVVGSEGSQYKFDLTVRPAPIGAVLGNVHTTVPDHPGGFPCSFPATLTAAGDDYIVFELGVGKGALGCIAGSRPIRLDFDFPSGRAAYSESGEQLGFVGRS